MYGQFMMHGQKIIKLGHIGWYNRAHALCLLDN